MGKGDVGQHPWMAVVLSQPVQLKHLQRWMMRLLGLESACPGQSQPAHLASIATFFNHHTIATPQDLQVPLKWGLPEIGLPPKAPNHPNFNAMFHYKPSIWGYPLGRNPCRLLLLIWSLAEASSQLCPRRKLWWDMKKIRNCYIQLISINIIQLMYMYMIDYCILMYATHCHTLPYCVFADSQYYASRNIHSTLCCPRRCSPKRFLLHSHGFARQNRRVTNESPMVLSFFYYHSFANFDLTGVTALQDSDSSPEVRRPNPSCFVQGPSAGEKAILVFTLCYLCDLCWL